MKVCVVGTGYVGLVAGTCFAECGNDVIGVDPNPRVQASLRRGLASIDEPELQTLVTAAINSGRLRVGTAPEPADAFIIAVPTPVASGQVFPSPAPSSASSWVMPVTVMATITYQKSEACDGFPTIVNIR